MFQTLYGQTAAALYATIWLQDTLELLPQELHRKMLPASRTIALRQTSKTMRTAVEKADAVVQARSSIPRRPRASGQVERLERVVR